MANPQYAPNHTIDPETGYLENKGYGYPFDGPRKKEFIKTLVEQGLGLYRTCDALGISHHTIFNHLRQDEQFKHDLEEARSLYADDLDAISKQNARNPKSVIERIFQLKSLFPERYADQKNTQPTQITINIDPELLSKARERAKMFDAEVIPESPEIANASVQDQPKP